MKKIFLAILLLLVLAFPAFAAGVHYTGLTSTNNRSSFATSYNWLAWEGIDFSEYGGGKWFVRLTDSAGAVAEGYAGAVGSGETYDTNVISNGSFTTDTVGFSGEFCTIASVSGGQSGNCLEVTMVSATQQDVQHAALTMVAGASYLLSIYAKSGTSGDENFAVTMWNAVGSQYLGRFIDSATTSEWVLHSAGYNPSQSSQWTRIYKRTATAGTMLFDEYSLVQLLTPPATGIQILDGPTGASGWSKFDASFDYNDITEITIVPAATLTGVSASGVTVN